MSAGSSPEDVYRTPPGSQLPGERPFFEEITTTLRTTHTLSSSPLRHDAGSASGKRPWAVGDDGTSRARSPSAPRVSPFLLVDEPEELEEFAEESSKRHVTVKHVVLDAKMAIKEIRDCTPVRPRLIPRARALTLSEKRRSCWRARRPSPPLRRACARCMVRLRRGCSTRRPTLLARALCSACAVTTGRACATTCCSQAGAARCFA
jgi:hypothetical protein